MIFQENPELKEKMRLYRLHFSIIEEIKWARSRRSSENYENKT